MDPHSYADAAHPKTKRLALKLTLSFERQALEGNARLFFDKKADGIVDLDTKGLAISWVKDAQGNALRFDLSAEEPIRGSRLRVYTEADEIEVQYTTAPGAMALQWLTKAQTLGKAHPFVFTQCQAIHARSIIPCQDTPGVRATFEASIDVPRELKVVMAAAHVGREEIGDRALETFEMPQPIPSYLFAFAAGNLASRDLGPRSRIYAEPEALEDAAWEFAGVEAMIDKAEGLFGPYQWDRFDLLLMPPSFPYGGMENPRLTFLTPTLITKDRSLVNVVAHELAHSWTGNLVTNATMNDFWLNEGFTVYAERRILEALDGRAAKSMHAALGRAGLERDVERLNAIDPKLTRLQNELDGVDPDEVYSLVPYEKGYLFLERLEQVVGRERFDKFLATYINEFRFKSITTEHFVRFLRSALPEASEAVNVTEWIHGTGIPADAPRAKSSTLDEIASVAQRWVDSQTPPAHETLSKFGADEWQVFLAVLPNTLTVDDCAWLNDNFHLATSENYEIKVGFLSLAGRSGYRKINGEITNTLGRVGRMKYLRPLFGALLAQGAEGRALATETFDRVKSTYHPVGRQMVSGMLDRRG